MNINSANTKKNIAYIALTTFWFYFFTGGKLINPFYVDWIFPSDTETHWLGWQFFKDESLFIFPVFKNINYGLELGSSLVLNDSLAIMAIMFKPFSSFIPFEFQYFGIWTYICFVLQGFIAMKIVSNFSDDLLIIVLSGLLFVMLPPFLWRLHGHFGLLGHWLILSAFLIYISSKDLRLELWTTLIILSLLINAYISAMLIGIFIADLIKYKIINPKVSSKRLILGFGQFIFIILSALVIFGYFMIGKGAGGKGFGKFNANINSFLDPDQIWSLALGNLPTPEAGYEGFAFPGLGILLIVIIALITLITKKGVIKKNKIRAYVPIIIISILAYIFALSNNVTFGQNIIFSYELPNFLSFITKTFRTSGRFIWIIFYLIVIGCFACLIQNYSKRILRIVFSLVVVVQFADLYEARKYFNLKFNSPTIVNQRSEAWSSPMVDPLWKDIAKQYDTINYVFTSNRPKDYFPISHFAAKNKMKINTGYFSRVSKKSAKIINLKLEKDIKNKNINEGTLYFIYDNKIWEFIKENYERDNYLVIELDNFKILAVALK